jgi:hypothetical protein
LKNDSYMAAATQPSRGLSVYRAAAAKSLAACSGLTRSATSSSGWMTSEA